MNPWIALAVLLASIGDDILYVFFIRRVMKGSKLSAAILSGILTAVVGFEGYFQYAVNPAYILVNALGSSIGCPLAMWVETKYPSKKKKPPRIRILA